MFHPPFKTMHLLDRNSVQVSLNQSLFCIPRKNDRGQSNLEPLVQVQALTLKSKSRGTLSSGCPSSDDPGGSGPKPVIPACLLAHYARYSTSRPLPRVSGKSGSCSIRNARNVYYRYMCKPALALMPLAKQPATTTHPEKHALTEGHFGRVGSRKRYLWTVIQP